MSRKRVASSCDILIAGCGYGAEPDKKEKFQAECEAAAASFESNWNEAARKYALGPTRVQFQNKDPRGWAEFAVGKSGTLALLWCYLAGVTLWQNEEAPNLTIKRADEAMYSAKKSGKNRVVAA